MLSRKCENAPDALAGSSIPRAIFAAYGSTVNRSSRVKQVSTYCRRATIAGPITGAKIGTWSAGASSNSCRTASGAFLSRSEMSWPMAPPRSRAAATKLALVCSTASRSRS